MRGHWALGCDPCCITFLLAGGIPSSGTFLYMLSVPTFLGDFLQHAPTQSFWLFTFTLSGIMAGAAS